MSHKFIFGQTVMFTPGAGEVAVSRFPVMAIVTPLLPPDGASASAVMTTSKPVTRVGAAFRVADTCGFVLQAD